MANVANADFIDSSPGQILAGHRDVDPAAGPLAAVNVHIDPDVTAHDHVRRVLCHGAIAKHLLKCLAVDGVTEKGVGLVVAISHSVLMEIGSVLANDLPRLRQPDAIGIEQIRLADIGAIALDQSVAVSCCHSCLGMDCPNRSHCGAEKQN